MTFAEVKYTTEVFRALIRETTGRELISPITVDEPADPQDELHFLKLVSWFYVLLFEAGQPTARYIVSMLRAADPAEHEAVSNTFRNVNILRTVRVHNLSPASKSDDFKMRRAEIWLIQNGGDPPEWACCCRSLCAEVTSTLSCLRWKWRRLTENTDDAASVIHDLLIAVDREWAPHTFDRIVEAAAIEIGLQGFDSRGYRQSRLDSWRELVGFFDTREHAEVALRAAIVRELRHLFGDATLRTTELNAVNAKQALSKDSGV